MGCRRRATNRDGTSQQPPFCALNATSRRRLLDDTAGILKAARLFRIPIARAAARARRWETKPRLPGEFPSATAAAKDERSHLPEREHPEEHRNTHRQDDDDENEPVQWDARRIHRQSSLSRSWTRSSRNAPRRSVSCFGKVAMNGPRSNARGRATPRTRSRIMWLTLDE